MNIYYVTLNKVDEARTIGFALLEEQLAVCVNWFPITCAYRWKGEITEESEVVLIIKTQAGYRGPIEQLIRDHINYTNFIAEITPTAINPLFQDWLDSEVPAAQGSISPIGQDRDL
jgi:periplasmic divalent cation tolerance protein